MINMFYRRSVAVRNAITPDHQIVDRLRVTLRAHHDRQAADLRIDTERNTDRIGSNRAVYGVGTIIDVDGSIVHVAAKAAIQGRDVEEFYGPDGFGFMIMYELGALEHLARSDRTPVFGLPVRYRHDGGDRFALLTEDLTRGGTCRLESREIRPDRQNHQVMQVHPDGTKVKIWADLKTFGLGGRTEFIDAGARYLEPNVTIDVGVI